MHRDAVADASANVEIEESGRMDGGLVHPPNGRSYVGDSLSIGYEFFEAAANRS